MIEVGQHAAPRLDVSRVFERLLEQRPSRFAPLVAERSNRIPERVLVEQLPQVVDSGVCWPGVADEAVLRPGGAHLPASSFAIAFRICATIRAAAPSPVLLGENSSAARLRSPGFFVSLVIRSPFALLNALRIPVPAEGQVIPCLLSIKGWADVGGEQ